MAASNSHPKKVKSPPFPKDIPPKLGNTDLSRKKQQPTGAEPQGNVHMASINKCTDSAETARVCACVVGSNVDSLSAVRGRID